MNPDFLTVKEIAKLTGHTERVVQKQSIKGSWPFEIEHGKKHFPILTLPGSIQAAWVSSIYKGEDILAQGRVVTIIDALAPEAVEAFRDVIRPPMPFKTMTEAVTGDRPRAFEGWLDDPSLQFSLDDLRNPRVSRILTILRDVDDMPPGWKKGRRRWIETVALKHSVTWQSIYKWIKKYKIY